MLSSQDQEQFAKLLDRAGASLRKAARLLSEKEEPPRERPIVLCASNRWDDGMTHPEAFAYDESLLGDAPTFAGYHGYEAYIPVTWAGHKASKIQDRPYAMANIKGFGIETANEVVAFAETVPPRTIIVFNHEPSNPVKSIPPAVFVSDFKLTYEQFRMARDDGRIDPTVELWSNFMSYLWRTPERDPADWVPLQPGGGLACDGILLNGYWGPTTASFSQIFGPALNWLTAVFGSDFRWGIGEISCHTESHVGQPNGVGTLYDGPWLSDEKAQQWVVDVFSDAEAAGAEIIAWFSSPVGPRGPWHLDEATGAGIAEWWQG